MCHSTHFYVILGEELGPKALGRLRQSLYQLSQIFSPDSDCDPHSYSL